MPFSMVHRAIFVRKDLQPASRAAVPLISKFTSGKLYRGEFGSPGEVSIPLLHRDSLVRGFRFCSKKIPIFFL
jgi:hypothetical protein